MGSTWRLSVTLIRESSASVPWHPKPRQKRGVKWLLQHGAAGVFLTPGLGKTSITLAALKILIKEKVASRVLLIAPLRVVYSVWPQEIEKWSDFKDLRAVILHGPDKDAALQDRKAQIFLINPEGLPWLIERAGKGGPMNSKLPFDTLVIDELTGFKNPRSQRFKMLKPYLPSFARRWGLTGTPNANGYEDLFGQIYMLDLGRSLGRFVTHFRNEYFLPQDRFGWNWRLKTGADTLIAERIAPLAFMLNADEQDELPDKVEVDIPVYLPAEAFEIYTEMELELIAKIKSGEVTAANAAAAIQKCRQIANGAVYTDAPHYTVLHSAKLDALEVLIEELQGAPLLVGYHFDHDRQIIQQKYPLAPSISSATSAKKGAEIVKAFVAGEIPLLLAHPQSAGHGLNLHGACRHVAWYGLTYDYERYDQFRRRVWRGTDRSSKVFIYHLISKGTVDEIMHQAVKGKARTEASFFKLLSQWSDT